VGGRALGLVHGHAGFASLRDFASPKQEQNPRKISASERVIRGFGGEDSRIKTAGKETKIRQLEGVEKTS
jgi:hypothetical protein